MTSVVQSGCLQGVRVHGVRVEASPIRGLPGFDLVGLPEAGVRESRVRVLAALRNSGFELPERRFVVNLAPADLRKGGSSFDLAIAIALLAEVGLCAPNRLEGTLIVGELSLDGGLRPVRGLLSHLLSARERGLGHALIPRADSSWASLVPGVEASCAETLLEAVAFLGGERSLPGPLARAAVPRAEDHALLPDLRDVRGQHAARRALEVAAAGNHGLLMVGPPGSGKSMLAQRLPSILPPPSPEEALEIATIASASGLGAARVDPRTRPFRAPHHSCSDIGLIGGGDPIRPGEVTLAHGGVLFLDELPELRRSALEVLRPTMESGLACVVRARDRVVMPARPLIVAAMNPCPCGYHGHPRRLCRCTPDQIERYCGRVSGPLLDRFDLHVPLPPVSVRQIERAERTESSAEVRARVVAARAFRAFREAGVRPDPSQPPLVRAAADFEPSALALLHRGVTQLDLSLRAYGKLLAIARTIADLAASARVCSPHVAEALQYRLLERTGGARRGASPIPSPSQGGAAPA